MNKRIIDKANIVLSIAELNQMYSLLQRKPTITITETSSGDVRNYFANQDDELETISDILTLTTTIIRLVENEDMREFERRYDELYDDDETLVKDLMRLAVEVFDLVIHLHEQNNLILWQPEKGAVLVNGN